MDKKLGLFDYRVADKWLKAYKIIPGSKYVFYALSYDNAC